ncbi:Voltage-gated Ion Channel (VIC) Superfamily [Phytophthora infestans T30-4]|uniref:Voltage-gated Ion Channel (VIC) Superfamily n=1 Tax=Phytophthora infestans (strain T30-4) TaxID=403677 RepID=D0P0S8_PHYIT|nr:Voltage-gated Ion Channel (VIC) Superfamily [Phytophthora infestans T30-4]EEY53046.1 Voltage-gated Ion Channel (VIC) Superfamily [Phytophthora infestans T30-4]|eukprot:XP_002896116.1 Voltage-gated Ion Channel (VIC) Superfamily [Phytophthora infestans T30-4]
MLELVALVPVEILPATMGAFNVLHLVRLTKLCRLYKLRRCFARIAKIYSHHAWAQQLSSTGVDTLVGTIGLCAGVCHWVACGYMLIAHFQCGVTLEFCHHDAETSWVVRDRLFGASVGRKYGRTLYWASRTLVLLGYDDVTPVSTAETLYVVAVVLMGALFGSSLLANFLFLFRFRNARYAAYTTHVDNAREYMRSRNIPRPLRHQVTAFFSYSWNAHHSLDGEEALRLMPKHLQSKVVSTIKASRIKQVCFLAKESVEFANMLALALVRRVYSPGDQIIEPKINAETFFVIRGKVVVSNFNGSNAKEFSAGDFFADACLLDPEQYEQKAVAKTFCELYVLAKSKFDQALAEFYRGNEADVRLRMTDTLDKYLLQLQKMQKMLGLQAIGDGGSRKKLMSSHSLITDEKVATESGRGLNWRLPGSYFSVGWDTARLAATIYVAFEVPYFAVFISMGDETDIFMVQQDISLRYVLTVLIEVLFGIDLILRARYFAYLEPSVMLNVVQPSLIFDMYKANGFYLDVLAWLPMGLVLDFLPACSIQRYSAFFRLLRMLRMRLIPNLLTSLADFYGLSSKLRTVVFLVLGVTLTLHMVGCAWFLMTLIGQDKDSLLGDTAAMSALSRPECLEQASKLHNCTWVIFDCYSHIGETFPIENPDSMYQASFAYLRSLYWAVVTLTAVGYGDIVAYSTAESYFAAFWIFVGGIINFGVVGAMSSTISTAMAPHHHYMEKINTLNHVLERIEISEHLSGEIRRFYHQQFTGRKQRYESQLLSHLPDQLCYKISSLLHSEAVKCIPLFNSASSGFLKEVTGQFRHRSYQNGETICLEGDVCRDFFVFLHNSKVNLFFRLRKAPVRALCNGDSYGVNELLLRRPYPATLRAASHVQASVMTRDQFDLIQRKFSRDVTDMKPEAEMLRAQEQNRLERIVANLEKLKLQPHSMHTPTLFYQRDAVLAPKGSRHLIRDVHSLRESFTAAWNALVTCWNVYNAFFVVFRVCFHPHLHFSTGANTLVWVADISCDVCFALDIYLRLYYLGCPEVGVENLLERKEIDKQYRRSSTLKWDILASLPVYTPFASGSWAANLCRVPRLVRCVDLWTYLDDAILLIQQHFASHNVSAYLSPVKLLVILVLVAHYVGCIFFWISERECQHVDKCWVDNDHLLHQYHHSLEMLYAKSFYWATTTLLLVGSRESTPRDMAGTLWTGFTCLCSDPELGKETKHYKSHVASFESFATTNELPQALRERVTYFFRVQFEHTKGSDLFSTVHDLSANLRLKLMLEIYGSSIANLPICRYLTSSQVNNLALRLKPELFIPGDDILVEGTYGSRLCTLRKGMAAAFWTRSVAAVAILMEGAFFGEIAFFLPSQRRLATVKATTFCEVLSVSKHDWKELWASGGNAADDRVQKHALHAILGWVGSRLQRYQKATLRSATRAKHLLSSTPEAEKATAQDESGAFVDEKRQMC